MKIEDLQFEKCAVHFNPAKRKLLFNTLMLLLFFVAHVLETELLYFFYDTAQVIYQAFVFNLVLVQVAAIVTLYTIDDLVSEL